MQPHEIRFEGGNGDTKERPIVIRGARSELEGTYAAYSWLVNRFGPKDKGWKLVSRSHAVVGAREIDTFVIELPDGTQRSVHFDCTETFGKF